MWYGTVIHLFCRLWSTSAPSASPCRVATTGCHVALSVYTRGRDAEVQVIDLDDEYQPGDMCWLETPPNPTREARDIQYYADKASPSLAN